MRSIKHRFDRLSRKRPGLPSFILFCEAVRDQHFTRRTIELGFNRLVEKDDYTPKEKKEILASIQTLTEGSRNVRNEAVSPLSEVPAPHVVSDTPNSSQAKLTRVFNAPRIISGVQV